MPRSHQRAGGDAGARRPVSPQREQANKRQQEGRERKQENRHRQQESRERQQESREVGQEARERRQEGREAGQESREAGQEGRERQQESRERGQQEEHRQLDERDRLRDMFVAVLGHDLRSPLSAIKMTATVLLKRHTLSEPDARAVTRIERAAVRMETMASQLLDLTRTRLSGGLHLERSEFDIVALITEVLGEFRAVQPDREVRCELPARAEGVFDRTKVAQAVSNFLRNAFEYAPKGTPIDITVREKPDSISVEVTNEGPAIAAAVQPGLFYPFRPGRRASSNGLGLGLFIAREIAVAHGGTVSFTSKEGATRFTLNLPRLNSRPSRAHRGRVVSRETHPALTAPSRTVPPRIIDQ